MKPSPQSSGAARRARRSRASSGGTGSGRPIPVTGRHINRLITGDEHETWLGFTRTPLPPGQCWATASASAAGTARLSAMPSPSASAGTIDGFDIAEEALDVAGAQARDAGLGDRITIAKPT